MLRKEYAKLFKMMEKIVADLEPQEYKKIDDIRIDLCVSSKNEMFDDAWQRLACNGTVDICGNEIRLNQ